MSSSQDHRKYKIKALAGKGGQANVYEVKRGGRLFAMKVFQREEHFRREFDIVSMLNESFPKVFPTVYDKVLIH